MSNFTPSFFIDTTNFDLWPEIVSSRPNFKKVVQFYLYDPGLLTLIYAAKPNAPHQVFAT